MSYVRSLVMGLSWQKPTQCPWVNGALKPFIARLFGVSLDRLVRMARSLQHGFAAIRRNHGALTAAILAPRKFC